MGKPSGAYAWVHPDVQASRSMLTMWHYLAIRMNEVLICAATGKNLENIIEWEEPGKKGHIRYCCIHVKSLEQAGSILMVWGASLVAQWLRIRLQIQETWALALVWEDPTCRGAAKPVCHNYWACTLEPVSHNYWAHVPQLRKPACLEPVLCNKRSHWNEKPAHRNEE